MASSSFSLRISKHRSSTILGNGQTNIRETALVRLANERTTICKWRVERIL